MALRRVPLGHDVVTAARARIIRAFDNGVKVYLSLSGGKDSVVLAHLVHSLIEEGRVDPQLLHVQFIDEEAVFDEVDRITRGWRKRFLLAGASFDWYCIEVRHYNCFNQLANDESFICWDSTIPDRWIRPIPGFAITDHPDLRRREDTYQDFLIRISRDGIKMTGTRVAESVQRLFSFTQQTRGASAAQFQPIYDWRDTDIWRYIGEHQIDFPSTYLRLYQLGLTRREMRISQFFSIDTARSLVRMAEHEPDLMARIVRREPNAYLAALYWDSELFRSPKKQKAAPGAEPKADKDWKAMCLAKYGDLKAGRGPVVHLGEVRNILKYAVYMTADDWRSLYGILEAGDPKKRSTRALRSQVFERIQAEEKTP